ncbi:MAG: hypothetical protein IKO36_05025 [Bacteroidaceae bacterium]|nr:hypothetical protein [Bacteroidaceae bacterium]
MNTKELLDEYFKTKPESTTAKTRGQIDRKELYAYEEKVGKQLIDMDCFEIADMLKSFSNQVFTKKTYKMSYRTYDFLLTILRDFFEWYIDNYKIIKNPCNDKRIRGRNAIKIFNDTSEAFTKESMEDLITNIRNSTLEEYADYEEAIIRMFYEGFPEAIDIVNLKCIDINHEKKTAMVRRREIQLSDRLYELLVKIHNMDEYPAYRGSYLLLSYRDSYFKFPTRESFKNEFQDRPPEYWAGHISRLFNRDIKVKNDININARTLYLCGFYDYIVDRVGKEEANRLIYSIRNTEDTKKLMGLAEEYGVTEQNVTTLKKILVPFVQEWQ